MNQAAAVSPGPARTIVRDCARRRTYHRDAKVTVPGGAPRSLLAG
jgi:hypothetical protein